MKSPPLITYLIPIIILVGLIFLFKGNSNISKETDSVSNKPDVIEKTSIDEKTQEKKPESDKSDPETSVMDGENHSRISIYPNAQKAVLEEEIESAGASFYTSVDTVDAVKEWYLESMGGLMKVNMIDITSKDGKRTVTLSLPDPPNELIEIKENYLGTSQLLITITTVDFYTRNQPREYHPPDEKDGETNK